MFSPMSYGLAVLTAAAHAYQVPLPTCPVGPALCGRPDADGNQGTCPEGTACHFSLFGTSSCYPILDDDDQCVDACCEDDEVMSPFAYCGCVKKDDWEAMFCQIEEEVDDCPPGSLCDRLAEALRQRLEAELAAANRIIQFNDGDDDVCRKALIELEDQWAPQLDFSGDAKISAIYLSIWVALRSRNIALVDNNDFLTFALNYVRPDQTDITVSGTITPNQ